MKRQTNWKAMQVPQDMKAKKYQPQYDVCIKRMSMGSWRADASKHGVLRLR